jgi:hypothetical protein
MVSLQDETPTRIFVECPFNLAQFRTIEMDEIKNENELGRRAEVVTTAAHLGLALQPSHFTRGIWIACCPGTNHTLELKPKQNLSYCACCRAGGGTDELVEFAARKRRIAAGFTGRRTLH